MFGKPITMATLVAAASYLAYRYWSTYPNLIPGPAAVREIDRQRGAKAFRRRPRTADGPNGAFGTVAIVGCSAIHVSDAARRLKAPANIAARDQAEPISCNPEPVGGQPKQGWPFSKVSGFAQTGQA
jgi:hypothetical protein